jgi:hypothetical protein
MWRTAAASHSDGIQNGGAARAIATGSTTLDDVQLIADGTMVY